MPPTTDIIEKVASRPMESEVVGGRVLERRSIEHPVIMMNDDI